MFFKKAVSDEKRICALCEYSSEDENGFKCGKKKVSPTHSCRRFIYDPLKKKDKRLVFDKNEFSFEAID
jgi:hypothetical protein